MFPAASRARAVSVCGPFAAVVVFQDTEYGLVVSSAPRLTPSSRNCTPATPTPSLAAAVTFTVPSRPRRPAAGAVTVTVGGVVSGGGGAATAKVTTTSLVVTLPAPSRQRT